MEISYLTESNISAFLLTVISVSWVIGAICIYKKYDKNQKICSLSDLIQLTFSGATLWFVGAIFISFYDQARETNNLNLASALVEFSDYNNEFGYYTIPTDPVKKVIFYKKIESWFSQIAGLDNPPNSKRLGFIISGTPEAPMRMRCMADLEVPNDPNWNTWAGLLTRSVNYKNMFCEDDWG